MLILNNLSNEEIEDILETIKSTLESGEASSLLGSISYLAKKEKNKKRRIIFENILSDSSSSHFDLEDKKLENILYRYGIVNKMERFLLEKSINSIHSIDAIIELKKYNSRFAISMITTFILPFLALYSVFLLAYLYVPFMEDYLVNKIARLNGKTIQDLIEYGLEVPWWFDRALIKNILIYSAILFLSTISLYFYNLKYNIALIFKYFPLKIYDVLPSLFFLMDSLKKSGLSERRVIEIMSENIEPKSLRIMFIELQDEIVKGSLSSTLELYNFPVRVVSVIQIGENVREIWNKIDRARVVSISIGDRAFEKIKKRRKFIWWIVILIFIFSGIEVYFKIQSISEVLNVI